MAAVFDRWHHALLYSGPFLVYKQYYEELNRYYWASYSAHKLTYKGMASMGITWADNPDRTLLLPKHNHSFTSIRSWSNAYNELQVWTRLNVVISLASILETYMDTICGLAIESNPGVLINASKSLDGVHLLKTKRLDRDVISNAIRGVSKGTWGERRKAFDALFGGHPIEMENFELDMEELRKKRNSVGHAFGRDINKARRFEEIKPLPLDGIKQENLIHFFDVTLKVAKAIDQYLLDNHIGEYQALFSFHVFYTHNQGKKWDVKGMAKAFRKIFSNSSMPIGKQFFVDLVEYYNRS